MPPQAPTKPQPRIPPRLGCCEASEAVGKVLLHPAHCRDLAEGGSSLLAGLWPSTPLSSSSDPCRRDPPGPHPTHPEDTELPSRRKKDSLGRSPVPAPSPLLRNFNRIGVITHLAALGRADGSTSLIFHLTCSHPLCQITSQSPW